MSVLSAVLRDRSLTDLSVTNNINTRNLYVRNQLIGTRIAMGIGSFADLDVRDSLTAADLRYPVADGLPNQVLETDGSGSLTLQYPTTVACFCGQFRNFTGSSTVFCAWGTHPQSGSSNPLYIPYPCTIIGYGLSYSENSTPISIDVGESVEFDVGQPSLDVARDESNYNPVAGSTIVWDDSVSGTYPQTSLTGLNIPVSAGSLIAMRARELGGMVQLANAEVTVTLWLRGSFV